MSKVSGTARVNQNKGSELKALNAQIGARVAPNVIVVEQRDQARDAQNEVDLQRRAQARRRKAQAAKRARKAQRGKR